MGSFVFGVVIGVVIIIVWSHAIGGLRSLLRGDGHIYSIQCMTCGMNSGKRWYRWTTQRWADKHVRRFPRCGRRTMIGNRL